VLPRGVYEKHLDELKDLMKKGTGRNDIPDIQNFNQGSTLLENAKKDQ
jgi:hypothetical protein